MKKRLSFLVISGLLAGAVLFSLSGKEALTPSAPPLSRSNLSAQQSEVSCKDCDQSHSTIDYESNGSDADIARIRAEYESAKATLNIPKGASLEDQFAAIRALQYDYFGDEAARLFERENAYYQYKVDSERLRQDLKNQPVSEQLDALSDLKTGKYQRSPYEQYEQAIGIYDVADASLRDITVDEIAERYLPPEEAQLALARREKRQERQTMQDDFQSSWNAFILSLEASRETKYADLSETQWQQLMTDKKREFRTNYFNKVER